ncbi:MAG: hypothetical protein AAGA11_09420 [Pseudomonadota bacterium]
MIVRTAYFEGELSDADAAAFQAYMRTTVAPIIRTFPGCLGVQINVPVMLEPAAPQQSLLMIQHGYESEAALEAALASDQRRQSMEATVKALERYGVTVFHINHRRETLD